MPCTQRGRMALRWAFNTLRVQTSPAPAPFGIRCQSLLLKQADESYRVPGLRITGRLQKLLGIELGSSKHPHFMLVSWQFHAHYMRRHDMSAYFPTSPIMYNYNTCLYIINMYTYICRCLHIYIYIHVYIYIYICNINGLPQ